MSLRSFARRSPVALVVASLAFVSLGPNAPASADEGPPGVARISVLSGDVDYQRADASDSLAAAVNAPLMSGDYLTTGDDARGEVQFSADRMVRLAADTQVRFTRLEPDADAVQLAAGMVQVAIVHADSVPTEIDTPSVAVRCANAGDYRIAVSDEGSTEITVRRGEAEVMLPAGPQTLSSANTMVVSGSPSAPQVQFIAPVAYDAFDGWNADRDREIAAALSLRYAGGIVGAPDLDPYGHWVDETGYGEVWVPAVGPGWAPYRDGRWVWEPYYGWTWVSYEPWGWAPYHYGRWFFVAGTGWCWYPGPAAAQAAWQPALVVFIGFGAGFSFGFGNLGWVPLAPFEPFHPWWGPRYVNHTTIVNVNVTNLSYHYRNLTVNNAVTSVAASDFAAGRFNRQVAVAREQLRGSTTISGPLPIVPGRQNLRVSDRRPAQLAHAQTVEQTFHSFPAPVYQTIPFERQRASIQAATRAWYAPPQGIPQMRPDEHVQGAPAAVYHAPKTHVDEIHHAPPHPRKSAGKDRHDERSAH